MEYLFLIQGYVIMAFIFGIARGYIKMNTTINTYIAVLFALVTLFTFATSISTIQTSLNEAFEEHLASFALVVIIIFVPIIMLASISFITNSLDYIIHKRAKQKITVKLSKKSKLYIGGYLIFDVKFTGWLFAGYYVIHLQSPYLEENQILIQYNDVKKLGNLNGRYTDKTIQLRCNVPKHWGHGKYDITVKIDDVCTWLFSLKKIMNLSSENLKVMINEPDI